MASHDYNAKYYAAHKDELLAANKQWHLNNPDYEKLRSQRRRNTDPTIKPYNTQWKRNRYKKIRLEVLNHYGKVCQCCGEATPEFLGIDHVDGGGSKHRRETGLTGSRFYIWLHKNHPDGFQTLCHNCNMAKGLYGICPHQRDKILK